MKHRIALLIALIVGYCVFVFALASTLMAQRYEYRATPIETGPITVPCFVVDRFNFLCVETGDIFVNVAGRQVGSGFRLRASFVATTAFAGQASERASVSAAATPSIILAHRENATGMFVNVAGRVATPAVSSFASPRRDRIIPPYGVVQAGNSTIHGETAATPSIILAHQKIASDAWGLAAQDRDAYQQWIHDNRPACCDHRDCKPARVEWTPNGWRVEGADNLIAERDIIAWPFAVPYACIINRYARCLFLNSGG